MVRAFWLYGGKKRGARRSGPRIVGTLGEAAFQGALFALGGASLVALIIWQVLAPSPEYLGGGRGFWALVVVLTSFFLIGGGGLVRTLLRVSTSAERRSALARQAADLELIGDSLTDSPSLPTVPSSEEMTNSPGVLLKFRLPPSDTPAWKISAGALLCGAWLMAAAVSVVIALQQLRAGQQNWLLFTFGIPFLCVGAWAFQFFVRQLWMQVALGPTSVEISDLPLHPGDTYEAALVQQGGLQYEALELWLICEEEAVFQQGTDVRTETLTTHRQLLYRGEQIQLDPSGPFEEHCRLSIPPDAMHSFQSGHNGVNWKLLVHGEPAGLPDFERSFPVVVHPAPRS